MSRYTIERVLKLFSPLHVASPGKRYVHLDSLQTSTNLENPENPKDQLPITLTTRYPIVLSDERRASEPDSESTEERKKRQFLELPVFPANDLRGRLRRLASDIVFDGLRSRNEQISLEVFHAMTWGAVTGQPSRGLDLQAVVAAGTHAFLGLFGGGPRMVHTQLQIMTLWPITESALQAGLVPERYAGEKSTVNG